MSKVVLVSDKAVIGIETVKSKLRVDPVGKIRDLFCLESIFSVVAELLVETMVEVTKASMEKSDTCVAMFMFSLL